MQMTRTAKPLIKDPRLMGVARPGGVAARAGSDRACSAVEGAPDVPSVLIRGCGLRAGALGCRFRRNPRARSVVRCRWSLALGGAEAEPEPAAIMNVRS